VPPKINVSPTAGLFRRGKLWHLRFVPGPGLPQQRVALHTSNYDEAVARARVARSQPIAHLKADKKAELIEAYLADAERLGQLREVSVGNARPILKEFVKWMDAQLPDWSLADIGEKHVVGWRDEILSSGQSPHTANTKMANLSGWLQWAVRGKKIFANPIRNLKYLPTARRPRSLVVPPDVSDQLIADCPRQDLKLVLFAGFQHGLRKNEIVSMRASWVNFVEGYIEVPAQDLVELPEGRRRNGAWKRFQTKNGHGRFVPLSEQFRKFLEEEFLFDWEDPTEPFLLHPERVGKRYRWDPRKPFGLYMAKKGLPEVTMHVMRHSYITALAAAGMNAAMLSEVTGDEVRTLSKNYLHLKPTTKDLPIGKLPKRGAPKVRWVDANSLDASENGGDDAASLGEPPPRKRKAATPKIPGGTQGAPPLPSRGKSRKL
jgi:integrase